MGHFDMTEVEMEVEIGWQVVEEYSDLACLETELLSDCFKRKFMHSLEHL
jgi:hypothetical protein